MIISYEREKIGKFVGSEETKISFAQKFGRLVHFAKDYTQFFSAGVYQLEQGPPIIILPWFLKDSKLSDKISSESGVQPFFEIIREIKSFTDYAVDLKKDSENVAALDIIVFSFLTKLHEEVASLCSYNYHEEITERTNVLRGKWDIPKDLSQGSRPLQFTCTYNSFEMNTPFFRFIKSFTRYLTTVLKSRKNLGIIDEIQKMLLDVEYQSLNRNMVLEAICWLRKHGKKEYLIHSIEFAESLIVEQNIFSKGVGTSYQFQMDRFFENLVISLFQMNAGFTVQPQTREDVLGGAYWRSLTLDGQESQESRKASQKSIPDVIVFNERSYFVFECKYKPFRIPFINDRDSDQNLSSFSRDDRNQLLSFMMSIRPSPELKGKRIEFAVFFPVNGVDTYLISELHFESAKLYIDPIVRNLIQNRIKSENREGLSIRFVGLNVSRAIEAVATRSIELSNEIVSQLSRTRGIELNGTTDVSEFQRKLQKRIALSSLIVNKSSNDPTLGRVKLAKLFYLADAHLKLGMGAEYQREAAGPLDSRLFYNEKWGIESLGNRQAYFRRIEHRNGNRYVPGKNISQAVEQAKAILVDKIEHIEALILLLAPLNTERAEIVTTLYACWNDLLSKGVAVSDKEIVDDFLQNWHPSKMRFDRNRLEIALKWMRDKGLVPDGTGALSHPKQNKLPVGF